MQKTLHNRLTQQTQMMAESFAITQQLHGTIGHQYTWQMFSCLQSSIRERWGGRFSSGKQEVPGLQCHFQGSGMHAFSPLHPTQPGTESSNKKPATNKNTIPYIATRHTHTTIAPKLPYHAPHSLFLFGPVKGSFLTGLSEASRVRTAQCCFMPDNIHQAPCQQIYQRRRAALDLWNAHKSLFSRKLQGGRLTSAQWERRSPLSIGDT